MNMHEYFWVADLDEIIQGYVYQKETSEFTCLFCGKAFSKGVIYQAEDLLLEAEKAMQQHLKQQHESVFLTLLNLDKKYTGLSENQKYQGMPDKDIQKNVKGGSLSTIRNYRFFLNEKEKQARVFLAIMHLFKKGSKAVSDFVPIPGYTTMMDERFAITEEEYKKTILDHFPDGEEGILLRFPKKEKRKIIVLLHLLKKFQAGTKYSEKQVNAILMDVYHDYATIRRYMIEYGFMDRKADGSEYWVKG